MHKRERKQRIGGRGTSSKVVVLGLMQRGDKKVRVMVVKNIEAATLQGKIQETSKREARSLPTL